ncbi:MAG: 50S ribosomal protein L23 [Treponema sp.]|jgi:large subunit ribosomal protein L23|nr:50S ribosomal protein L23 [Treponema sp.]MEE3433973.1 50S ribosomal protein L23 [Treponema sp.]
MEFTDILIEPVITEKANALREENKYVFIVRPDASKIQIKEAVRKLFNVKVLSCTTINVAGKVKRLRGSKGMTASYKKAIVRVADGETIKLFE